MMFWLNSAIGSEINAWKKKPEIFYVLPMAIEKFFGGSVFTVSPVYENMR